MIIFNFFVGKSPQTKVKIDKGDKPEQPEKVRTCGINCAVCGKHVQKSYSCCTFQTAPERFKYLFTGDVRRVKICRKCIPYKKVVKTENQIVKKKTGKVKQKRGRKPKANKLATVVKVMHSNDTLGEQRIVKDNFSGSVISNLTAQPFPSVMQDNTVEESASKRNIDYDRHGIMSIKMENKVENMDITTQDCENAHLPQLHFSCMNREEIPVGVFTN